GASDARPPGPWFGAIAFNPARAPWPGFAPVRFFAPEILVWENEGRRFVAAISADRDASREALQARLDGARRTLEQENAAAAAEPVRAGGGAPFRDGRARWSALVDLALQRIHAGELSKVVVARSIDVLASPRVATVLERLERAYPSCRTFYLRGDKGPAFLGATPENFCSIDGVRLRTEALAGSARPGEAAALLESAKDLREHEWVVQHIVSSLRNIAEDVVSAPAPAVRELANVAHLQTPISARLRPDAGLADVVAALHPTPAVGGVPAAAAVQFLDEHEQLDRGLYSGLVGFVGPGRAELAVALRCALVDHGIARLFLGAGIVDGSSAESEWVETQLKARALLDAFEGSA
ncbi:MAG TPA: isochorismate synthase, partial [Myxococcales bacterium]|nr:isochorismate synthase [Myxococcales bacterium]